MSKQPRSDGSRRVSKVRPVPIKQMRVPPVGVVQRKFSRQQAERYAADFDFQKMGWPIVNLRDGIYWIVDGQHRIEALKIAGLGEELLDCEVYEGLSDAEMATIFLGRDDRRRIDNFTKFLVACTAGHARECEVRRLVESNGLKISRTKEEGCVGAVSALLRVYDSAPDGATGSRILGQVLRTIRDAYAADPKAFDGFVIEALGLVYNRYNGKTNEKELVARLSTMQHGMRGLMARAESQRLRTGNQKVQCICATIVDLYNRGMGTRASGRLPSWWKEAA